MTTTVGARELAEAEAEARTLLCTPEGRRQRWDLIARILASDGLRAAVGRMTDNELLQYEQEWEREHPPREGSAAR